MNDGAAFLRSMIQIKPAAKLSSHSTACQRCAPGTYQPQTDFAGILKTPREKISSIILLPPSHQSLYDASYGFSGWKASSKNAWRYEDGGLVTSASGSLSRVLPEKDAVEIEFQANWERSLYFRVQMFSDNRSTSSSSCCTRCNSIRRCYKWISSMIYI